MTLVKPLVATIRTLSPNRWYSVPSVQPYRLVLCSGKVPAMVRQLLGEAGIMVIEVSLFTVVR